VFDIHFILPITEKVPYNQRISHLKNYAFLNPQDKKVLITFLGDSNDKYPLLQDNWPEGITVEFVKYANASNSYKVNKYLSELVVPLAKWTGKIDDDTTNDIFGLCSIFDEFYDWQKEYYLGGEINTVLERDEKETLEILNLNHHIKGSNTLMHEFEGCFVSWAAMNTILTNETAKRFLKERTKFSGGFTDQAFGMAAQLAKIYPIECRFLSTKPTKMYNFTLFGGKIGHIHFYVNCSTTAYNYWLLMLSETTGPAYITSKNFNVYYEQIKQPHKFTFTKNGIIKIDGKIDEWRCYWKIENNLMIFLDSDLNLNAKFEISGCDLFETTNNPKTKSIKII